METPDKKELITGITELFQSHEEPYEAGSWENFSSRKKAKKLGLVGWIGIAAALLILLTAVPYVLKNNKISPSSIVKDRHQPKDNFKDNVEPLKNAGTKEVVVKIKEAVVKFNKKSEPLAASSRDINTSIAINKEDLAIAPTAKIPHETDISAKTDSFKKNDFAEFLAKESHEVKVIKTKEPASKWDFGIELLPTVLQSKMTMGAGLTTEFKLSKSFSISSGIAYMALDAGKNIDRQPVSLMSNKKLVSIDANIRAIDIPISLTYNVNKQVYTSIGISYFGVLSERRNNKYVTEMEVSRTVKNPETGIAGTFQTNLIEQNNEVVNELPLDGNGYLGFFNLSVGHKQEVFKNYKIVIEPFLKIPVGKLSNEDLKLSNGGVKLRFSF